MNRPLALIADDEPDAVALLTHRLQKSGIGCIAVADGIEELNAVFEHKPDVIILDLMMPRMNGLEVCRMLKTNPVTRRIPVPVLTARASPEDKLRGFGCGADDYVTKPFELSEVITRVFALLRRRAEASVP
jgi:DNA-binding response OmpR family regulator